MSLPLFQVDAFTATPFGGNPAAVCLLEESRDDQWMQLVAREMNLSETAFLVKQEDGYQLRWFTPAVEVALCGHATLASAHILWEAGYLPPHVQARFHTLSGLLTAEQNDSWIRLDFPAQPAETRDAPAGLLEALDVRPVYIGKNRFDYLLELESEAAVRAVQPDFSRLSEIEVRGVIVTSRSASPAYDFVSRFFAPRVGVNEDPVTGSAHCCLSPYWSNRLGRETLLGYQASPRGGTVRVQFAGDRVYLSGQAVTIMKGTLE